MAAFLSSDVRPLGAVFGAEVFGFDLAREDGSAAIEWIKDSLAEHAVLVFRDQSLSAQDLARLGRQLGNIEKHMFTQYRHEEVPEVSYVTNRDAEGNIDEYGVTRASKWHFDEFYKPTLPRLTVLHALKVPQTGGGTEFADTRAAYDGLQTPLKEKVENLVSVFRGRPTGQEAIFAHHPTVHVHPVSGRHTLLISPQHQLGFEGMVGEDGLELMEELLAHITQPKYYYYHHWRLGDVLMWDQIATIHRNAADSDPNEPRVFLRTIVQ